jgi:hypothetical protein
MVPGMDDVRNVPFIEDVDGLFHLLHVIMGVGDDADCHCSLLTPGDVHTAL